MSGNPCDHVDEGPTLNCELTPNEIDLANLMREKGDRNTEVQAALQLWAAEQEAIRNAAEDHDAADTLFEARRGLMNYEAGNIGFAYETWNAQADNLNMFPEPRRDLESFLDDLVKAHPRK